MIEVGLTPAELRQIGERLYGPRWQTKLARALPVSTRAIRYWLSGERKIRPVVAERIRGLLGRGTRTYANEEVSE